MNSQPKRILEGRLLKGADIPFLLRQIAVPPKQLWIVGSLPGDNGTNGGHVDGSGTKYLCVVGSRKHSTYAREACEHLIRGLAGYNICIVSGLALGIDSVAHRAALAAGVHTIAFPGSGLDEEVLYPPAHRQLAQEILEAGGALLSEFDLKQGAAIWTFPQRNRLMAGMSHATLIVEAAENSGTLITMGYATDESRDLLALPGSIFSPGSYGPHKLIRNGATPITCSADILEALGIPNRAEILTTKNNGQPEQLTFEQLIVDAVTIEPLGKEDLLSKLQAQPAALNIALSMLEIDEVIEVREGKVYLRR